MEVKNNKFSIDQKPDDIKQPDNKDLTNEQKLEFLKRLIKEADNNLEKEERKKLVK